MDPATTRHRPGTGHRGHAVESAGPHRGFAGLRPECDGPRHGPSRRPSSLAGDPPGRRGSRQAAG